MNFTYLHIRQSLPTNMFRRSNTAKKRCQRGELPQFVCDYIQKNEQNTTRLPLEKSRFVVFDTETTGLDLKKDKVISIGAIGMDNMQICVEDSMEIFVRGNYSGDKDSVTVHQILSWELKNGHTELQALEAFLDYIGNSILVAHYAEFDTKIMSKMMQTHFGFSLLNKSIDTIELAKRMERGRFHRHQAVYRPKEYTLDNLCERYGIPISIRHNAAGDSLATAFLLQRLLYMAKRKGIKTVRELL